MTSLIDYNWDTFEVSGTFLLELCQFLQYECTCESCPDSVNFGSIGCVGSWLAGNLKTQNGNFYFVSRIRSLIRSKK